MAYGRSDPDISYIGGDHGIKSYYILFKIDGNGNGDRRDHPGKISGDIPLQSVRKITNIRYSGFYVAVGLIIRTGRDIQQLSYMRHRLELQL